MMTSIIVLASSTISNNNASMKHNYNNNFEDNNDNNEDSNAISALFTLIATPTIPHTEVKISIIPESNIAPFESALMRLPSFIYHPNSTILFV